MTGFKLHLATIALLFPLLAGAQTADTAPATTPNPDQSTGPMAASASIKILSPKVDEKIGSSAVTVKYQLSSTSAAADSSPTYKVQMDSQEPVETIQKECDFSGLKPGKHVVTVQLVDANHNPIAGSLIQVSFTTADQTAPPQKTGALNGSPVVKASMQLPSERPASELPSAGSELPLLSMVGFGVLVGGVISAMRTRK